MTKQKMTSEEWALLHEKMKRANNELTEVFHKLQASTGKTSLISLKQVMRKLSHAHSELRLVAAKQIGNDAANKMFIGAGWVYWS